MDPEDELMWRALGVGVDGVVDNSLSKWRDDMKRAVTKVTAHQCKGADVAEDFTLRSFNGRLMSIGNGVGGLCGDEKQELFIHLGNEGGSLVGGNNGPIKLGVDDAWKGKGAVHVK